MYKYYIFYNNEQIGPLSIKELKKKNITNNTLVWKEGLPEWIQAKELEDLKDLFYIQPPSIKKDLIIPPAIPNRDVIKLYESNEQERIFGINRYYFWASTLVIVVIAILYLIVNYKDQKFLQQNTLELQLKLKEQEDLLKTQNDRIAKQEKIERERIIKEKLEVNEKRRNQLAEDLNIAYTNLNLAKKGLNNATAFKFLRTSDERNNEIKYAEAEVEKWKTEINYLEKEITKTYPK